MTAKTKKDAPQEPFERSLEKLEGIVRDLESGEKGLEESLGLFEDGISLAKGLTARLEEAKHRVEVLTKDGGKFKAVSLEEVDGSDNG